MSDASMRRDSARFLILVAMLCWTVPATAQPSEPASWRLTYTRGTDAPVNCPDESYIRTALAAKMHGRDPFAEDAPRALSIHIALKAERVEARIEARDDRGSIVVDQTIHAPSWRCDQLADRTVFVVRDIVDPLVPPALNAGVPPSASAAPPTPPAPPPATPQPHHSTPKTVDKQKVTKAPESSPRPPKFAFSAAAGAAWWSAPETAVSLALGADVRWLHFSIGLEGLYDHAWQVSTRQSMSASVKALSLLACGRGSISSSRVFVRGCGLARVSVLSLLPGGEKLDLSPDESNVMFDIGVRFGAGFWLSRSVGFEVNGDAALVLRRSTFVLDGEQTWRAPRFTGAARAGLVVLFDLQ